MPNGLAIEQFGEFDDHQVVMLVYDQRSQLRGFIAIHRGGLTNPALGATRFWEYGSERDAIADALRLSRLMSYKSALAGLKYGGAKGVLVRPTRLRSRKKLFKTYAERINYLGGRFITGTDVGLDQDDLKIMRSETPYAIGTRVDGSYYTAVGVVSGIRAALKRTFGKESLKSRSFAIQGVGKTGKSILELIYKEAGKVYVADVDRHRLRQIQKRFRRVRIVSSEKIHAQDVDVFVPCALSSALTAKNVADLQCSIVAGSANNQLEEEHIGVLLHQLGILYAPDYVINAGGIISVVDELEHESPNQRRIAKSVARIKKTLETVFARSKRQAKATNLIADAMAERIFNHRR